MRMKTVTLFASAAALCACEPIASSTEASPLSESCCGGIGVCAPKGLISEQLSQRLPSSECEESWECAPVEWVIGVSDVPASCRTPGEREGRCLPGCMPELAEQGSQLAQQSCDAGYLCAPCFDPLTGEDTQACRIAPDPGPEEPAPVSRLGAESPLPDDDTASDDDTQAAGSDCSGG